MVIVGGGPAGMACALRLSQLIDEHNAKNPDRSSAKKISTCSRRPAKSGNTVSRVRCSIRAPCANCCPASRKKRPSRPRSARKPFTFSRRTANSSFPSRRRRCAITATTSSRSTVLSSGWAARSRKLASPSSPASPARSCSSRASRVTGVRTDDKGVDKQNQPKSNFEPGYDLKAKVGDTRRGPARFAHQATDQHASNSPRPQPANLRRRRKRTLGSSRRDASRPAKSSTPWAGRSRRKNTAAPGFTAAKDNIVSLGFVTGLDYPDPRLDPQHVLQEFKQHPFVARCSRAAR